MNKTRIVYQYRNVEEEDWMESSWRSKSVQRALDVLPSGAIITQFPESPVAISWRKQIVVIKCNGKCESCCNV